MNDGEWERGHLDAAQDAALAVGDERGGQADHAGVHQAHGQDAGREDIHERDVLRRDRRSSAIGSGGGPPATSINVCRTAPTATCGDRPLGRVVIEGHRRQALGAPCRLRGEDRHHAAVPIRERLQLRRFVPGRDDEAGIRLQGGDNLIAEGRLRTRHADVELDGHAAAEDDAEDDDEEGREGKVPEERRAVAQAHLQVGADHGEEGSHDGVDEVMGDG